MNPRKVTYKWSIGGELSEYEERKYDSLIEVAVNNFQLEMDEEIINGLLRNIAIVTINKKKYIINSYRDDIVNSDKLEYINIICKVNKKL